MKKKLIALSLCLAMLAGTAAGCSGGDTASTGGGDTASTASETGGEEGGGEEGGSAEPTTLT